MTATGRAMGDPLFLVCGFAAFSGDFPAQRDTVAGRHAEQVGDAPHHVVLKFGDASVGIDSYGPVFTLDGKPLGANRELTPEDHPAGLVGTDAVAGLAATDTARAERFTEALWNTNIPSGRNLYYDGMLYLMSLMHASGQFRIWMPL